MANYDKQMADRVWKRVQGEREEEKRDLNLKGLILSAQMASATYQQLSRQLGQREGPVLQRLAREDQGHGACLKGIYTIITDQEPVIKAPPISAGSVNLTLRKCYAGLLKTLQEYEQWSTDPEYGPVFQRLADQEQEHCRLVLELIGRL